MRKLILTGLVLLSTAAYSQTVNVKGNARVDFQEERVSGKRVHGECGPKGKFLNLMIDGTIAPKWSYSIRQRIIRANQDDKFFDNTDWAFVKYRANDHIWVSAGKEVVRAGGYEYDRTPIDNYFCSEFANNVGCYRMGVSLGYDINKNHSLVFQVCDSPFRDHDNHSKADMYGFNLVWNGKINKYIETISSINMSEYQRGKYINYIALGLRLNYERFTAEVDFWNRAQRHQTFMFKDCSLIGELKYQATDYLKVFTKFTYDVNNSGRNEPTVYDGTEIKRLGGGVEYCPLKNKNIRLHAVYAQSFGNNTNPTPAVKDDGKFFSLGLTWHFGIYTR